MATRQFNQLWHCANCKTWVVAESLFSQWMRGRKDLDAQEAGFAPSDMDFFIHKYKTFRGRDFQCAMVVEVKTYGKSMEPHQEDTLAMLSQVFRNRKVTPTSIKKRLQAAGAPVRVRSLKLGRDTLLKLFGVHVLRFSGGGPQDSEEIRWDNKLITQDQLAELLRFDLDPDTLNPLDLRSHHARPSETLQLFQEVA